MNISIKSLLCVGLFLFAGCGNNVIEQLTLDLSKGYCARFTDDELDGHRVYGYDASRLNNSILEMVAKQRGKLEKLSETEIKSYFPLVYFVALKYENRLDPAGKIMEGEHFRLQFGAIDFFRSPEGPESPSSERPSCTKCFTFFFLSEDDNVEILSVDVSRNLHSASSFQGKCLSYGSVNSKIQIWDAFMPDRNRPEKILEGKYKKAFAVMTDHPFNYMPYTTSKKLEFVELLRGEAVYRLCWQTPECMIFVPEALLPGKKGGDKDEYHDKIDAPGGPHGH